MIRSGLFDEGGNAVALLGVEVRAEVVAGHACAVVRQRYKNENAAKKAIEAIYTFPLPTKAVLTGFSMTVEGRTMVGEVHERDEAFRRYDDAITGGHGAALLEQERPNVFTANVGNLLFGEETIIEIQYVEPILADEGAVRWSIPTLVAPRYIPGVQTGDRTAHGSADPTNRVPDADRISPPMSRDVAYGLELDLTFDLGVALEVQCPSHQVVVQHFADSHKANVKFCQREVPLDRDIVVTAFAKHAGQNKAAPIAGAISHRKPTDSDKTGTVALTIVPDLLGAAGPAKRTTRSDVVFVIDRSGSMGGSAMTEAKTALRLCIRQLREGDRFNILAFDTQVDAFSVQMVPFGPRTLQQADQWLDQVDARGGTELLEPMLDAIRFAPDGVIVLLTDGEVGNEDEILSAFMSNRNAARVYSFGIGTNVSDTLLLSLADRTGGAVEMIHPGERIDEKVVAQFARATSARVINVQLKTRGIEIGEMAPAEPRALVDGEPWSLFATYEEPGNGVIEIRGTLEGTNEAFFLEVPVELAAESDRPVTKKLWAQARIVDLERSLASGQLVGRRADSMKARIIGLAKENGVSSKFTSFVVIEKRTGDRRMNDQPETQVVPVNVPADWSMFDQQQKKKKKKDLMSMNVGAGRRSSVTRGAGGGGIRPSTMPLNQMSPPSAIAGKRSPPNPPAVTLKAPTHPPGAPLPRPAPRPAAGSPAHMPPPPPPAAMPQGAAFPKGGYGGYGGDDSRMMPPPPRLAGGIPTGGGGADDAIRSVSRDYLSSAPEKFEEAEPSTGANYAPADRMRILFSSQSASGLWEESGKSAILVTTETLLSLLNLGLTTADPVHGALLKKAIDALLLALSSDNAAAADTSKLRELALGVAWLLTTGHRTRQAIEANAANASLQLFVAANRNESAVRERVEELVLSLP